MDATTDQLRALATLKRSSHKHARKLFQATYGPIPRDWHVHHRDGNPFNNELSNLEAIPARAHLSEHGKRSTPARTASRKRNLVLLHAANLAFQTTERGKDLARMRGKRAFDNRQRELRICDHCGSAYEAWSNVHGRFCTPACKAAARRASGIDNESRVCIVCGSGFTVNRYESALTCGRSCAGKLSGDTRRGKPQNRKSA